MSHYLTCNNVAGIQFYFLPSCVPMVHTHVKIGTWPAARNIQESFKTGGVRHADAGQMGRTGMKSRGNSRHEAPERKQFWENLPHFCWIPPPQSNRTHFTEILYSLPPPTFPCTPFFSRELPSFPLILILCILANIIILSDIDNTLFFNNLLHALIKYQLIYEVISDPSLWYFSLQKICMPYF